MYAICKTTHPPTLVEHSIYCHFYNYSQKNLVTAGLNQLKVYRLIDLTDVADNNVDNKKSEQPHEKPNSPQPSSNCYEYGEENFTHENTIKLECLQVFNLNANIESLNYVQLVGADRDCLLLAFNDAKLSIVEYDANTHELKTISMHYFEDDDLKGGYTAHVKQPIVRVDPENRCAAMLIFNKNIIIIPFRKDGLVEESEHLLFSSDIHHSSALSSMSNKRSPVLPTYRLPLNSEQYGVNITNILDIQFLHNYYEPTLMILFEPVQTWPGRIAVRQDTVSMITLSLDVHQKVHPHIWSLNNLPYNTFAAMPIPKPIGGVLIFAANALIHLNQGSPPYGISLNGFNDSNTSFPLKTQDNVIISLDCCQATFISNEKILLSLNDGQLYVLKLFNDMTRSVRTFHFIPIASSVIATTITKCQDGFFFIGSRLGHSILVQYIDSCELANTNNHIDDANNNKNKKNNFNKQNNHANDSGVHHSNSNKTSSSTLIPIFDETYQSEDQYLYGEDYCNSQKKLKLDSNTEQTISNDVDHPKDDDQPDEHGATTMATSWDDDLDLNDSLLQVYKSNDKNLLDFSVRLCDIIYNIGPCGYTCLGESNINLENAAIDDEFDVELVTTSGYFKNGAITVLQRSIKPQIETSFKLPGCLDCWTAYGPTYYSEKDAFWHKYLIINQTDSTLVFEIGHEINELDQSGFITQAPTIFVGNIGDNKYILQVCANSVRLLDGTHQLQHFPIDIGSALVHASMADPYCVLMSEKGSVILLCLKIDAQNGSARLMVIKPDLSTAKSTIVALCIYKDVSGLFSTKTKSNETIQAKKRTKNTSRTKAHHHHQLAPSNSLSTASTIDEEDELLYGDSMASFLNNQNHGDDQPEQNDDDDDGNEKEEKDDCKIGHINKTEPTFWLFIVRENGVFEIYNLPEFKLVYLVKNFPLGLRVLVDSIQSTDHSYQNQHADIHSTMPITKEIVVCGMGVRNTRPHLFARFDEDFFIYEIFAFFESQFENHLKIRFKKITTHYQFVKHAKFNRNQHHQTTVDSESTDGQAVINSNRSWLRPFSNIGGYSGVFLCGPYPCWFLMTERGELRAHAMDRDGAINSFAPFNNVNCPDGYLYFNLNEELRFTILSDHLDIDSFWPIKHVPLKRTVHFVNYHLESKTYAVATSKLIEINRIVRIGGEEKDYDFIEADSRYIACKTEQFQLQLLSPVNWTIIPGSQVELDEWEHITCLKNVMLSSEGTSSGLKGLIAFGTNFSYGEDVTNRGRIWILDIIEVVPEPGKPLTKNKFKILYCKDQKGPVTAICQVRGFLLSAIGQKIYIWQLKESQLIGIAFIDTQIYVHTAVSLRNLILVGDVYKSISLLRYQEETRTLSLVSRDHRSLQVFACEYLIDNTQMCFLVSDSDKNILAYVYQPDLLESLGGTRLIRRADFHLGSLVNSFFRMRCKLPFKQIDNRIKQNYLRKHITMFATLDGSIGYLLPIAEKTYRRLLMLQNLLTTNIQHIAGLNPKAFRMVKMRKVDLANPSKNILDGDLLFKYLNLPLNEKLEIAKKIGTSNNQIMDDLQESHLITAHF